MLDRILNLTTLICLFLMVFNTGCSTTMSTFSSIGTAVGEASGAITPAQGASIRRASTAVAKTFEDITPEQEYYIGRTVAATILNHYQPYTHREANNYLNLLGQTLAQFSDKPETFGGYHFLIMDSSEINAFAAPGGFVLVSKGLIRCCKTEDALAAVLAHEIGHVQYQHGLQAIRKDRLTSAITVLAMESAKTLGGAELSELTQTFESSVSDITSTLVNNGYSRGFERQADQAAVQILQRSGYNPYALIEMLLEMKKNLEPGGLGFARTHPAPDSRIAEIRPLLLGRQPVRTTAARQERFTRFLAMLD